MDSLNSATYSRFPVRHSAYEKEDGQKALFAKCGKTPPKSGLKSSKVNLSHKIAFSRKLQLTKVTQSRNFLKKASAY